MGTLSTHQPFVWSLTGRRVGRLLWKRLSWLPVEGGVDMVQLRKKDLPGRALLEVGLRLKQAIDGRALLIVNERVGRSAGL